MHVCVTYLCMQVLGATFDGASVNWCLSKLHDTSNENYKVCDIHAPERSDQPPHLIKTTINCWSSKCQILWI